MRRLILGLLALLICGHVHAADISWDGITGGLFSDSAAVGSRSSSFVLTTDSVHSFLLHW